MEPSSLPFHSLAFILLLLFFHTSYIIAQTTSTVTDTNTTRFSCTSNLSSTSCSAYLVYRVQAPDFLDLGRISDLFGLSRLSIMKASNLPSEELGLVPDQLLLIPVSCSCAGNYQSFTNITYQIRPGDSFYWVSIHHFQNLTDYHVVMNFNPNLEPTNLKVGQEVVFPLYCKCPTRANLEQGLDILLTYVWQPGDDLRALSKLMNTSIDAIVSENNYLNFSAAADLPIVIPLSQLPIFPHLVYQKKKSNSHTKIIIIIITAVMLAAMALCSLFSVASRKLHRMKELACNGSSLETNDLLGHSNGGSSPWIKGDKLMVCVSEYLDKPVVYEVKAILEATMHLNERSRIGGSVHQAVIDGEVFAVKQARSDVTEEVHILQKVFHANLVKLRGVSSDADGYFFLVYEFAENGSLDKWLYSKHESKGPGNLLSWRQRLNIALDVANGLQYLHEHTVPRIVHRNIRTSNILLDSQFRAKISNFSMAMPSTISITPSVDVFAFGVVLLELLSGRRAMESKERVEMGMRWREIRMILRTEDMKGEMLKQLMDVNLDGLYPPDGALSLAAIAKACTSDASLERPSMAEIVFNLSVLAQSCTDEFERPWHSNSEEHIQIMNPVFAR